LLLYSKHISKIITSQIPLEVRHQQDERELFTVLFSILEKEFSFYVSITVDELFRDVISIDSIEEKLIAIELKA
jgi:hypothetical protein